MYLDSGIIIKLLVPEPDSEAVESALRGQLVSSSELAWTEVASALLAKERAGDILQRHRDAAWRMFSRQVERREIVLHPVGGQTFRRAQRLLERCHPDVPLRSLDAIHLASCDLEGDFPLCTTDRRMRAAAERLDIPLTPLS